MAAKVLIVKVTRKHIRESANRWHCPIERAAMAVTGEMCGATEYRLRVGGYPSSIFFAPSRAARQFIKSYDAGEKVKPATFRFRKTKGVA